MVLGGDEEDVGRGLINITFSVVGMGSSVGVLGTTIDFKGGHRVVGN